MVKPREELLGNITLLDEDGYGFVNVNNSNIINVGDPINGRDGVNKNYVDNRESLILSHEAPYYVKPSALSSVSVATIENSPIITAAAPIDLEDGEGVVVLYGGALPILLTPPAPICTVVGTPGTRTVTYYISLLNRKYGTTAVSVGTTVTNAPNTLDDTNFVRVNPTSILPVFGSVSENVNTSAFNILYLPSGPAHPNGSFDSYDNIPGACRVLLTGQTDPRENGPWEIRTNPVANVAPLVRPADFDTGNMIDSGALIFSRGQYENRAWQINTGGIVDTDEITFVDEDPWQILVWISPARTSPCQYLDWIATRTTWSHASWYEFPLYKYDDTGRETIYTGPTGFFINNTPPSVPQRENVYARVVSGGGTDTIILDTNIQITSNLRCLPDASTGLLEAIEAARISDTKVIAIAGDFGDNGINCWQDLIIDFRCSIVGYPGAKPTIKFGPMNGLHLTGDASANGSHLGDLNFQGVARMGPPWFIGYDYDFGAGTSYTVAERHRCEYPRGGLLFLQRMHTFTRLEVNISGGLGIASVGTSDQDGSFTNLSEGDASIATCDDGAFAVYGYDASQSTYKISGRISRKVGILDGSFTGCVWISPHTEGNFKSMLMHGVNNRSIIVGPYFESGQGRAEGRILTQWTSGNYGTSVVEGTGHQQSGLYFTGFKVSSPTISQNGWGRWIGHYNNRLIAGIDKFDGETVTGSGDYYLYNETVNRPIRCPDLNVTDSYYEWAINNFRVRTLPAYPRGFLFGRITGPNTITGTSDDERLFAGYGGKPGSLSYGIWTAGDLLKDTLSGKSYGVRRLTGHPRDRANTGTYYTGAALRSSQQDGLLYTCIKSGITASSEPAGYATAEIGTEINDGTVIVKAIGYCAPSHRVSETVYAEGVIIQPYSYDNQNANLYFKCTTAGTSSAFEPSAYATALVGETINDGTAIFTAIRYPERQNSTSYPLGKLIAPQGSPYSFICTLAGITDSSEPLDYITAEQGDVVTDGYAEFTADLFSVYPDFIELGQSHELAFVAQSVGATGNRYLSKTLDNQATVDFSSAYTCIRVISRGSYLKSLRASLTYNVSPDDLIFTVLVRQLGASSISSPTVEGDFNDTQLTVTIPAGDREAFIEYDIPIKIGAFIMVRVVGETADNSTIGIVATIAVE